MVNQCNIIGRLGADPELRTTASGTGVANFRVAVNEKWKKKDGTDGEETTWFSVVVFGKLAEVASRYLRTGNLVYVEGAVRLREFESKGKQHANIELRANSFRNLSPKKDGE